MALAFKHTFAVLVEVIIDFALHYHKDFSVFITEALQEPSNFVHVHAI